MIELWQEFTIECSHTLPQPIGVPVSHGHSYWVRIYVETKDGDVVPQPMLNGMAQRIKNQLDHTHLNDLMDEPTMEGIANWIVSKWEGKQITRIKINRPSVGCGIEYWADASAASFWRAKSEHSQAECKHMKRSVDHAWEMVAIANDRLISNNLPTVTSPREEP